MTVPNYEGARFNRACEREEWQEIEATRASDAAFTKALQRAIRRGRENVLPGTFVDETPPIGVLRIRPEPQMSCCGSSAAMCAETGGVGGATSTLK